MAEEAVRVADSDWMPASWIMCASTLLRHAMTWCGLCLLFVGCFLSMRTGVSGFLLGLSLSVLSVLLHETGHALAAVFGGATLLRVRVGSVDVQPLRDGWRMRWKRAPRGIGGMVHSLPSPHRSLRRQMMATVVAGPAVNMVLGLGSLGLGYVLRGQHAGMALLGFGAYNALLALANLLPWSSASMLSSDGLQLLRWLRGTGDDDPQVAFIRLNARLISGERLGPWADEYLRVLERGSQPGPMFALWARMHALQVEGEWTRAGEVMREIELHIVGLSPPMVKALADFIAYLRCEASFSRVMAGETVAQSPMDILGPDLGWAFPALRLRCEALIYAIDGQPVQARARLAESAYWAGRSVDRSLEHAEAVVRQAVQARIDGAPEPAPSRLQAVPVGA